MSFKRSATVVAATAALVLGMAAPAVAAETEFHNGTSTSGKCGAASYKGQLKIDDPFTSGISYYGTASKWQASCKFPTTTAQTCHWTTVSLVHPGRKVGSGLWYVIKGDTTYPYSTKTYWNTSTADEVDSPVVCAHLIEGNSQSPKVRIYKSDGTYVTPTLYS